MPPRPYARNMTDEELRAHQRRFLAKNFAHINAHLTDAISSGGNPKHIAKLTEKAKVLREAMNVPLQ